MPEFRLGSRKSRQSKPTIKKGDEFKTIHGDIKILSYGNNSNVEIEFADRAVQPNPQWHDVAWIRRNEIKDEKNEV